MIRFNHRVSGQFFRINYQFILYFSYVGKFVSQAQRVREQGDRANQFTNIFVKNFADALNDDQLKELFSKFGTITSHIVMKDDEGKSRGFGFVAFEKSEQAKEAIKEMNNYELPSADRKLTVCRAQKKAEREAELRKKYAMWKIELVKKNKGVNLYVKNLEDTTDDEALRQLFEPFGSITSAKVRINEA